MLVSAIQHSDHAKQLLSVQNKINHVKNKRQNRTRCATSIKQRIPAPRTLITACLAPLRPPSMSNCYISSSSRTHSDIEAFSRRSSATVAACAAMRKGWERAPAAATGQNSADKLLCCHSVGLLRSHDGVIRSLPVACCPLRCPVLSPSYSLLKLTQHPGAGSHEAGAPQRFAVMFLQTNNYTQKTNSINCSVLQISSLLVLENEL
jgi:hypothetical protein